MKGFFSISVTRGNTELMTYKFQNMILKSGFDYILKNTSPNKSVSLVNTCILGNGTSEPTFTDTTLSGQTVGIISIESQSSTYSNTSGYTQFSYENDVFIHYHKFKTKATTFATISEIATAITDDSNKVTLFSKTLLKDSQGNNSQYTVAPGDEIEITYSIVTTRNKEATCINALSNIAEPNSEYWISPMCGLRHELDAWTIGSYSESVSKAGCNWSIEFDTSQLGTNGNFDVIFNLEYVEGSTAYGAFITTTAGRRFNFYFKMFNNTYRTFVPAYLAADLPNGRKIKIKQTFKVADTSDVFGTHLLGINNDLRVTGVANDLTKGAMRYQYDQGRATATYGKILYKRFIKPFTPLAGNDIDYLLLYNSYIYNEYAWDYNYKRNVNILPYLNSVDKLQINKSIISSESNKSRIYASGETLGVVIESTVERLDAFVYKCAINSHEYNNAVNGIKYYTLEILAATYGDGNWSGISKFPAGIKMYINDKELIYDTSDSSAWYLFSDGVTLNASRTNTLPVRPGDIIRIVGNGYDMSFANIEVDWNRYGTPTPLIRLEDAVNITTSLHTGFYGEINE